MKNVLLVCFYAIAVCLSIIDQANSCAAQPAPPPEQPAPQPEQPPAPQLFAPQPYSLYGTHVEKFHSHKVGIDYLLYVSLPRNYEKETASYPVVFVLDADYCFPLVQSISRFLADRDEVQPLVIVGITYPGLAAEKFGPIHKLNRTRDYTPSHVTTGGYGPEFQKCSGGADHYLDFIASELVPYLDEKFRVQKDRTIVGYSYGGLLASYAMLTRPRLFQRFIVVSPSLWFAKGAVFRTERKSIAAIKDLNARAFFSVGQTEGTMVTELESFDQKLRARKFPGFHSQIWVAEGETHHSVFPGAVMRGIRWLFPAVRTELKSHSPKQ